MHEFIVWVKKNEKKLDPVELAALAHHKLVHIHPFVDGNGRTARLFMNILLMQKGFPIVIILKNDRKQYYRALEKADSGELDDIGKIVAQAVERSLDLYLKAISSAKSSEENFISLSELAKGTKFSEKYLNLLARSGKLEAHKEGRNWVSTKKSLKDYLDNRAKKRN